MGISETPMANMGIKDKKATRLAIEVMEDALERLKEASGSTEITGEMDWTNWDEYDYDKMGKRKSDVVGWIGVLVKNVINDMIKLCEDEDFKDELQKLTVISVSGQDDIEETFIKFKLDGTTLAVKLNADAIGGIKNRTSLRAVWE